MSPIKLYKSYSANKPLKAKILLSLFITILTLSIIRALLPVTIKVAANSWFESNKIESTIGEVELSLFKGLFAINDVSGVGETGKSLSLSRVAIAWQWKPLFSGRGFVESIEVSGLKVDSAFYKNGDMNIAGIIIKSTDDKSDDKQEELVEDDGSTPWDVTVKKINFSDIALCVQKFSDQEKADLDYCAYLADFSWNGDISFNPSTEDKVSETVPVYVKGALKLKDIALNNNQLDLALVDIKAINVTNINIETPMSINIEQIEVNNLVALQRNAKAVSKDSQLLGFDRLSIYPVSLSNLNDLKLGKIKFEGAQAYFQINKDGQTDFAKWLPKKSKEEQVEQPAVSKSNGEVFQYGLEEFAFDTDKNLIFVDNSLKESFSVEIHSIGLLFENLDSTKPENKSHANLVLKSGKYGLLKLNTDLTPLANKPSINGEGKIAGIDLRMLAPFTKQYIGHSIKSGQLDADLKIDVNKGNIESNMGLALHHFELTVLNKKEAEELNSEFGFPLNSSLSLLRDRDNTIRLDIPVNGDVDNPEFDPSDAIVKASSKAITAAVIQYYTPFGLVFAAGTLFDLATALNFDPVVFEANLAEIRPEQKEQLNKLATLMTERPGVHLTLCGLSNAFDKDILFPVVKTLEEARQEQKPVVKPLSKEQIATLKKLAETRSSNVKRYMVNSKSIKASRLIECAPEFVTGGISGVEIKI